MHAHALADSTAVAWTARCADFVRGLGLVVREVRGTEGFLPGVRIVDGAIQVDPRAAFPGDLLHEAGHLAVIPSSFRHLASGALGAVQDAMSKHFAAHSSGLGKHPEDALCRAILQSSECEAIAWQFAAACALALPDGLLFPPGSFDGEGAALLHELRAGVHAGIQGLAAAGFTERASRLRPVTAHTYPRLRFWLQDAGSVRA